MLPAGMASNYANFSMQSMSPVELLDNALLLYGIMMVGALFNMVIAAYYYMAMSVAWRQVAGQPVAAPSIAA